MKRSGALCVCCLVLLLVSTAFAQSAAPTPEMVVLSTVKVKPEMMMDFEQMVQTEMVPAVKKGGGKWMEVWSTELGEGFTYYFVQPLEKMSALGDPSPLMRGLGEENFRKWAAKASRMINGLESRVIAAYPQMSHMDKMPAAAPKIAVVAFFEANQGRTDELEAFLKNEWLPIVKRSDLPGALVHKTVMGGSPNEYAIVHFETDHKGLDKGNPIIRVLGPEGAAKMYAKLAPGVVKATRIELLEHKPQMSFTTQPAQAAQQ